jgi:DNA-binding NtrC family response regulator
VATADPEEALQLVRSGRSRLILADVHMPGMDGYEFLERAKELVARAIHQISPVSQQKLAICNCSALVDTLLESQLFGPVRGSFTGATDCWPSGWKTFRCWCSIS